MGAVANMAPHAYRGIIAYVPFVDVVTTMLDETIPLTTNEFDQWGNPKEKEYYKYMLSYSPYDNVTAQDYPPMLVFTGLWDSQVQYHEGGKSGRFQRYHDTAREYAFILNQLGISGE